MELSELKFVVNTESLEQAAIKIEALGAAVSKFNKPVTKAAMESEKLAKAQAEVAEKTAKAALAQLKLEQAQTKSNDSTGKSTSVLERQTVILEFMAKGLSKGQSSYVATAIAAGALEEDVAKLITTLKQQRSLIGSDAFDKSIGLMQKLTNETKISTEVNSLFNRSLNLTEKQMVDLAREHERLTALYTIEKKDIQGLAAEYDNLIQKTVNINQANDTRTSSMKAQIKAQDDAAKATAYMATEMDRVNRLTETGGNITTSANNKLIKFEKALKLSGGTAAEQTVKLEAYRKKLLAIQKAGGERNIDYLSRALAPQITDIFVGLYSGQSPMTVLIQQGGQLRDQFGLAGVEGAKMGDMLIKAATNMVSSVKDVGLAIGQVFVRMIAGAGQSVIDFGMQVTGTSALLNLMRSGLVSMVGENAALVKSFDSVGRAMNLIVGTGIFLVIATLIALGIEYVKVTRAESELTKSLAMSGAALGMSTDDAIAFSKSMNKVGVSTMDAMKIIGEFADAGGEANIPLEMIVKSARDMEKYVGISTKETLKSFADIAEKPVEGLIKLAKSSGNVQVALILQAEALVKLGKNAEAATIAQGALEESNKEVVRRMINNLDPLQSLWLDIKSGISAVGQAIYELLKSTALINTFRTAWELIAVTVAEVYYVLKQTAITFKGIAAIYTAIMSGDIKGAFDIGNQMQTDALAARVEQDKLTASILDRNSASKETLKITEEQRQKNRKDAEDLEKKLKQQGGVQFKLPEDMNLKGLKESYKEATKSVDSESKKLLAQNKASYDLGLIDTGSFLSEEMRLIKSQNQQKTDINNSYSDSLKSSLMSQLSAINAMAAAESAKTKNPEDIKKLEAERFKAILSSIEGYKLLIQAAEALNEVLKDSSAEQQAKAIATLGQETKKLVEGSKDFIRSQDDIIAKRALAVELDQKTAGLFGAELERMKAQIAMEQSHIDKLSDLQKMATLAKTALDKLSENGMDTSSNEYQMAQAAVTNAQASLDTARVGSRVSIEKAGFDAVAKYQDVASQRLNAYGSAFEKMFTGMGDAIVEFAKTGKLNFSGLVNSMIEDLIRFEMKQQMTSLYASTGGAKGLFSAATSLFSAYSGSSVDPSAANYTNQMDMGNFKVNALGNAFGSSGIQAFANGGSFTNSIVDSPTLFKFAKGTGMMGEAGPEAIMPLRRGSDGSLGVVAGGGGSTGNVSVNVVNNSTSQATTNETTDSKGNRRIEVVIGDMTAGEISRSGSASNKSIKSTFGLQPQLIRR
jgi:lambda family phage tail tape measure protein